MMVSKLKGLLLENDKIQFKNFRAFWISFIIVFISVYLSYAGVKLPKIDLMFGKTVQITSPLPAQFSSLDTIKPKLEQTPNNFELQKEGYLIKPTLASGEFDQLSAYSVVDFNTGEVVLKKNIDQRLPIASTTKIMTAIVALDLAAPQELFLISEHAADKPATKLGMIAGQKMTVTELLNGLLLTSANDAAEVIKEGIDNKYSSKAQGNQQESLFIQAMNQKSKFLGLKNCYFSNPQGFDDDNPFCSAADLATLTHYALTNYPLIAEIVKKDYQFYPEDHNHKQIDMYNWNGLLGVYPGLQGVKIGNTGDAGYTTIVVSERAGKKVLVVALGAPGVLERDLWSAELLDRGFETLGLPMVNITESQLKEKYASWQYWN